MQYLLDIETLVLFLSSRRQSGELTTHLKRFPGIAHRGTCRVHLTLFEGKVTACTLHHEDGQVLAEGEAIFRALKKMGQLDWSWQALNQSALSAPPLSAQPVPPDSPSLVYKRIIPLEVIDKHLLTRRQWQVLLLVDGVRTAMQIAQVLMSAPSSSAIQEVEGILRILQQRGFLAVTR